MSATAYIIFVVVALLACALGAVGAYYYYRARHRETVAELEALDQDLAEREAELHRLRYQFTNTSPGGSSNVQTASQVEMQTLREQLEQKSNDYNILKQDFDLEIGILKQELDQMREEKSHVEHTGRHLARKDAELEQRAAELRQKELDVTERSKNVDAEVNAQTARLENDLAVRAKRMEDDLAARTKRMEEDLAARTKRMEDDLAERDRQLRAREITLEKEREDLERRSAAMREKQVQIDNDIFELPVDKFTSRQEAMLIKRLRQQIKLQRDELEHLQRMYHHAAVDPKGRAGEPGADVTAAATESRPSESAGGRSNYSSDAAAPNHKADPSRSDEAESLPAYSTRSLYVDHGGEAASRADAHDTDAPEIVGRSGRRDDLTSLPGVDSRLQEALYDIGITSFGQIARWTSADVRRVSERLKIDQKIIEDRWIINAQSHLFSRKAE